MKRAPLIVPLIALLGCGASDVPPTADAGKADAPVGPSDVIADQAKLDAADAATDRAADLPDASATDVASNRDVAVTDVAAAPDAADGAIDQPRAETASGLDGAKPDGGNLDGAKPDGGNLDGAKPDGGNLDGAAADGGESCTCDRDLSWACFCSVENCGRTLADFVDYGDGGKAVRTGKQTVVVIEYAACALVLVRAQTYSDYVPASEYVFEQTTGALVGATVQLDDRQHTCPWSGDARWVFLYTSGTRVPASCAPSACLPGEGSCASVMDAQ